MNRDTVQRLSPVRLAFVLMLFSLVCSLGMYLITRRLLGRRDTPHGIGGPGQPNTLPRPDVPPRPDVSPRPDVPHPAATGDPIGEAPPPHFTEETIIPGFTETGEQIERDDDTTGRSPGGV